MSNNPGWSDNSGYSELELYPNGGYKSFIPVIDTEWMIQNKVVKLLAGMIVKFYDSGTVQSCFLAEPATFTVFEVPVKVQSEKILEFHESGILRTFTVAQQNTGFLGLTKTWKYQGQVFDPGITLASSEQGKITSK
jgi:hypothetical protein